MKTSSSYLPHRESLMRGSVLALLALRLYFVCGKPPRIGVGLGACAGRRAGLRLCGGSGWPDAKEPVDREWEMTGDSAPPGAEVGAFRFREIALRRKRERMRERAGEETPPRQKNSRPDAGEAREVLDRDDVGRASLR